MKAITCPKFGGPEVLTLAEAKDPVAVDGEVVIRVKASGVNRADLLQRRGLYPPPKGESEIIGLEVAGVVEAITPRVREFRVGDRVIALLAGGGYAEKVRAVEGQVMPLPENLSFVQGAAIPEAFITAQQNTLHLGGATSHSKVLVHAGASGVGTAAIQLLRLVGATVWATVGSDEKGKFCEALGARPIHYRREIFEERILAETGGAGVDLILDTVGGSYLEPNVRSLAVHGTLVAIGTLGGRNGTLDFSRVLSRRLRIIGSVLRPLPPEEKAAAVARFASQFLPHFSTGKLRPVVDSFFPYADVVEAHRKMEANVNLGKIILSWE